jgi:cytochrome c5
LKGAAAEGVLSRAPPSDEFKHLRRAIEKAQGDRERATAFVCRLYHVRGLDSLPGAIRAAALARRWRRGKLKLAM